MAGMFGGGNAAAGLGFLNQVNAMNRAIPKPGGLPPGVGPTGPVRPVAGAEGIIPMLMKRNPGGLMGLLTGGGAPGGGGAAPGGMGLMDILKGAGGGGGLGMLGNLFRGGGGGRPAPFGIDPNSNMPITADVAMGARGAMMPPNMGGLGPAPSALTGIW